MSSILRALKKLEEEKARQRGGSVNLVHDILQGTSKESRKSPKSWPLALLVLGLLVAGGVGGMLMVNWMNVTISVIPDQTAPTETNKPSTVEVPAPPETSPQAMTNPPEAAPPAEGLPKKIDEVSLVPVENPGAQRKQETVPTEKAQEPSDPQPASARPVLTVSGIVYQQDPQSRMAVVNDLPVMPGTEVESARVEEILPDRVVFSFSGERFEVFLTTGN